MMVWFVAAMMILVAGIAMQARVDIRQTQLHADRARAEAIADGAISLALAEMLFVDKEGEIDTSRGFEGVYALGDVEVRVAMLPLTGLVDINLVHEDLLAMLLMTVDGVDENMAAELAANVVEWRSTQGQENNGGPGEEYTEESGGDDAFRYGRFEAIEDLLLVPGFDRRIFDAIRDAVYVSQLGQAGVDWMTAPVQVLRAIGDMDEEQALELLDKVDRSEEGDQVAPAELDLGFQESRKLPLYRVDAHVASGGELYQRRRWVKRGAKGVDGLPWQFFRTEAIRPRGRAAQSDGETVDAGF